MQQRFSKALAKRFTVTSTPGPDVLRVKLTLTGADTNTAFLSPLAHVDIGGNVYNGVQPVRGKEGLMMGWVMYAMEVENSANNQLLEAYEAKEYPNAFNIAATFGSLTAAKTGIDKGADMLAAQLQ